MGFSPLISDAAAVQFMGTKLNSPIPLAYGRHLVAGSPIFQQLDEATKNTTLFLALGIGEWDSVENIWINGVDVTDVADIHFHPGIDGEAGIEVETDGTVASPAQAPGTAANGDPGPAGSTYAWSDPNNAKVEDGSFATAALTVPPGNTASDYLELTNFGFAVPAGADIKGFKVELKRKQNSGTSAIYGTLQLVGVTGGTGKGDLYGVPWPAADTFKSFGSSTDLWGVTGADDAVVNNAAFGVRIYVACTGAPGNGAVAAVDFVRITVYYVPAGEARRNQKVCSFFPLTSTGLTFSRTAYLSMVLAPDPGAPGPGYDVRGIFKTKRVRVFDEDGTQLDYAFSQNPAWQILDLLLDYWIKPRALVGSALSNAEKAKIDFASFVAAADYGDELITVNGVDVSRFESNVVFVNLTNLNDMLTTLLAQCRGFLIQEDGRFKLKIDKPRSSIFTFDTSNIVEGTFSLNRKNTRAMTNRFVLQSRDPDSGGTDHSRDFAPWSKTLDHEAQQDFAGRIIAQNFDFGVQTPERSERLGRYILGRTLDLNRVPELSSTLDSGALSPGDRVLGPVDHDFDTALDYEVIDITDNPDGTRAFSLQEYSEDVFVDTAEPQQQTEETNIPNLNPATGAPGTVIVADASAPYGVAWASIPPASVVVALAPGVQGNFSVAHGLSAAPSLVIIEMTSDGAIWKQSPESDATNLLLVASAGGITGKARCWL